jgi:hypothetical protein
MSGDDYVRIECTIRAIAPNAVLIEAENGVGEDWIPRTCIHGADDSDLKSRAMIGRDMSLRVVEWLAKKKGLI